MEPEEVQNSKPENVRMQKEDVSPEKKEEITPVKEKESIPEASPNEEDKLILGKKVKRETKKINRELCSICRDGGNLLLCFLHLIHFPLSLFFLFLCFYFY